MRAVLPTFVPSPSLEGNTGLDLEFHESIVGIETVLRTAA
jgi:hypothetical protein